jgi:hypothetical protein
VSAWQPISTAPKDGTWVLLTGPGRWHALACWDHHGWYTGDTFVDFPEWWMPLPEPPA